MQIYIFYMSDLKCGTILSHTHTHIPTFTPLKQHWVCNKNYLKSILRLQGIIILSVTILCTPTPKRFHPIVKEPKRVYVYNIIRPK